MRTRYKLGDRLFTVDALSTAPVKAAIVENEETREIELPVALTPGSGRIQIDGRWRPYHVTREAKGAWVTLAGHTYFFERTKGRDAMAEDGHTDFTAPMPGKVTAVNVGSGDKVSRGQTLAVMEAMKMEHRMEAPADGVVTAVHCKAGDLVDVGFNLLEFEAEEA